MVQHFNLGKKVEVNPFEGVSYVMLPQGFINDSIEKLSKFLNHRATSVETRKVNGEFTLLFAIELLDFTTLVQWIAPLRGKFYLGTKSIHFRLEEDCMICW
jgi:hypothetical protein